MPILEVKACGKSGKRGLGRNLPLKIFLIQNPSNLYLGRAMFGQETEISAKKWVEEDAWQKLILASLDYPQLNEKASKGTETYFTNLNCDKGLIDHSTFSPGFCPISRFLWMWGITPPPAMVALMSKSSSSSPRIANCKCLGVILLTLKSLEALPASSRTSAVKYSRTAPAYTAAVEPTLFLAETLPFKNL